jgi:glycosyltransferase involved in cell wall biosynthesis
MSRAPKVSVIIPCYNLGPYLVEAVESVFAQTMQDFEILVVDDGSTDAGTLRVLRYFKRPRTRLLRIANRGLPGARNHAIAHAEGRYLCALDADDRLHPTFLEKTTALLDADPSLAFVSTWLEVFGAESWLWKPPSCELPALLAECVVLTASPVRREAVAAVGGYDERLFGEGEEDWDLWLSLLENGERGTILPEILFYYRRRPGSMSALCNRGEVRRRLRRRLIEKHRASYARHAAEVLLLRERECGELLRGNAHLEEELETLLRPEVARARAELEALA